MDLMGSGIKKCSFCGEEIPESQRRCPYCGSLLDNRVNVNREQLNQVNQVNEVQAGIKLPGMQPQPEQQNRPFGGNENSGGIAVNADKSGDTNGGINSNSINNNSINGNNLNGINVNSINSGNNTGNGSNRNYGGNSFGSNTGMPPVNGTRPANYNARAPYAANPSRNNMNPRPDRSYSMNQTSIQRPLGNGFKVFLTVLASIIPGIGQLIGVIAAIIFMNAEGDRDRKSFGTALLTASLLMFVISCIFCFIISVAIPLVD